MNPPWTENIKNNLMEMNKINSFKYLLEDKRKKIEKNNKLKNNK